jgi:guanylate kinase
MTARKRRGNLFIVSAPSGAGKTSLCQKLTAVIPDIRHSVSYTTRPPRKGEVNDRDYTFISEHEFRKMAKKNEFAEWAEVHGHLYGTSRKRLEEIREAGIDVILDIDTQGAVEIREHYDDGVCIFILPPSMEALRERLEKRMSNSPEEIDLRMKRASEEIKDYKSYDYVIVNGDFSDALTELKAIVLAENKKTRKIDPKWVKETFRI